MCGIVGVAGIDSAPLLSLKMCVKQDSRGKDATGVAWAELNEKKTNAFFHIKRAMSPVAFNNKFSNELELYKDVKMAVAHNRAASCNFAEKHMDKECHPFFSEDKEFLLMQNGTVSYAEVMRPFFEAKGHVFQSGIDSEILLHMLEEILEITQDRNEAFKRFFDVVVGNVIVMFLDGEMWGFASTGAFNVVKSGESIFMASEMESITSVIVDKLSNDAECYETSGGSAVKIKYLDDKLNLEMFGKWVKDKIKDGSWIYNKTVMCDFCRKSHVRCQAFKMPDGLLKDRCYECYKDGIEVLPKSTYSSHTNLYNEDKQDDLDKSSNLKAICSICKLPHKNSDILICGECNRTLCSQCFAEHKCGDKIVETQDNFVDWFFMIALKDKIIDQMVAG